MDGVARMQVTLYKINPHSIFCLYSKTDGKTWNESASVMNKDLFTNRYRRTGEYYLKLDKTKPTD